MTAPSVHPTAHVDDSARLGEGVVVERGCVVGPGCVVGAGTRLMAGSMLVEHTTLGERNVLHPYAVLGGDPQDFKFTRDNGPGELIIGDGNVFREQVTINRGAGAAGPTRIGSGCMFMAGAHAGHNAVVGDKVILANCASIAGHARVGDGCVLSAYCGVHQFTIVGEMAMFQGLTGASAHAPPFVILKEINIVAGLNRVGLRRSGKFTAQELGELKEAFRLIYRRRTPMRDALAAADERTWTGPAARFLSFIREAMAMAPPYKRALCDASRDGELAE